MCSREGETDIATCANATKRKEELIVDMIVDVMMFVQSGLAVIEIGIEIRRYKPICKRFKKNRSISKVRVYNFLLAFAAEEDLCLT